MPDRSGVSGVPDCWQRLSWGWYRSSLSLGHLSLSPSLLDVVWNADVALLGGEEDLFVGVVCLVRVIISKTYVVYFRLGINLDILY